MIYDAIKQFCFKPLPSKRGIWCVISFVVAAFNLLFLALWNTACDIVSALIYKEWKRKKNHEKST